MLKIILSITFFCTLTQAFDSNKCSQMLNDGWFKKYKFGGLGQQYHKAVTQESKQAGSSTAATNITTEGTTALSDPGYYSNVSTSELQSTSSWGECSLFAQRTLQKQQELYFEQNQLALIRQLALNQDSHLNALANFNLCEEKYYELFKSEIRANMKVFVDVKSGADFVIQVKNILKENSNLKIACFSNYLS